MGADKGVGKPQAHLGHALNNAAMGAAAPSELGRGAKLILHCLNSTTTSGPNLAQCGSWCWGPLPKPTRPWGCGRVAAAGQPVAAANPAPGLGKSEYCFQMEKGLPARAGFVVNCAGVNRRRLISFNRHRSLQAITVRDPRTFN